MEIEPGNTRQRSMTWSGDEQMRACTWRGCDIDSGTSGGSSSNTSPIAGAFAASLLPHRTLTFEDTSSAAEPLRVQVSST